MEITFIILKKLFLRKNLNLISIVIISFSVYVICAELQGMTAVSVAVSGHAPLYYSEPSSLAFLRQF